MRKKIAQHQQVSPMKQVSGGLLDLEFLVQFLVLQAKNPLFAQYTHTLHQIEKLFLTGIISKKQLNLLKKSYQHYHLLLHREVIQTQGIEEQSQMNQNVLVVMQQMYRNCSQGM